MSAADAFYRTVKNAPGGYDSLAPRMGISAQLLRNKANPNVATNHPYLSDIEQVMTLTGDLSVLHALAKEQNCVVVPIESAVSASDMAVLELVAKVWSTNGDVGSAVNSTLADGRVEHHEVEQVAEAIHRTVTALHEMLARLKGMEE
ncbi:hypothetical protein E6Q11_00085 [Candidatus Dojkabacteria bacterium]|uniref:XRE family transcriptional regulator n=1 Tax=Candidatus Dojkabacteria bacterium TaxID=2099670 RepID=A0A5C7JD11_9BACT|nr:MAG: hypothetical protein E6Q11_00085 [Candidatus Dojkabacteria bacterium]